MIFTHMMTTTCEFKLSTAPYPYEDHHASTIRESTTNLIQEPCEQLITIS